MCAYGFTVPVNSKISSLRKFVGSDEQSNRSSKNGFDFFFIIYLFTFFSKKSIPLLTPFEKTCEIYLLLEYTMY